MQLFENLLVPKLCGLPHKLRAGGHHVSGHWPDSSQKRLFGIIL